MKLNLQRIDKEAVVTYFRVLSKHLPGRTGEDHENPQNSQTLHQDSNWNLHNTKQKLPLVMGSKCL